MNRIKIVTDSSADLLTLEGVAFAVAPMKVITATREFTDDASLNTAEQLAFFDTYKGQSKSSCPNVSDWLDAFGNAEEIFCITITSGLSGSYNSACTAKELYESEHKGRRVFVLDSLSAGPEVTLLVDELQACVLSGMSFDAICARISAYVTRTDLVFMLKSLKNFANNGRVSPAVAKIAGILGICIVGKASDEGTLEPTHKCRGEARSLETLVADMETYGYDGGRVRIGHCRNEEAAGQIRDVLLEKYPHATVLIHELRGLCSFYAEEGGVLVGFEKRE